MKIPQVSFKPATSENNFVEIMDLGDLYHRRKILDHDPEQPHRVAFHALIYIEKGVGSHFIDFTHRRFEDGTFIFVRQNQVHAFDLTSQPQGKAILFTKDFVEDIQKSMRMPVFSPLHLTSAYSPVFTPSPTLQVSCKNLLSEIINEIERKKSDPDPLILMLLFSSLLLMIKREKAKPETQLLSQNQSDKLSQFITLLEQQFTQTRNASDYADQLHITYKTLNHICKLATKKTAKQLIDAYTILESKRRLALEKKSIQQVADTLGFDEATNFVKYFKKHTLVTPSDFRQ